jgi:hypothetical protein
MIINKKIINEKRLFLAQKADNKEIKIKKQKFGLAILKKPMLRC